MKIALGFRYAQTLLNLAFARFWGQFLAHSFVTLKKAKAARNSLRSYIFFLATLGLGIKLGKFAPIRDALPCR